VHKFSTQLWTLEIISSSTLFGFFLLDAYAMSFFFSFQNYSLRTFFFLGILLPFYFNTLPYALFLLYISLFTTLLEAPKLIMHNVFGCTPRPHSLQVMEEDNNNPPIVMCKQVIKKMAPLITPLMASWNYCCPIFDFEKTFSFGFFFFFFWFFFFCCNP
jgi:hypothetical protein